MSDEPPFQLLVLMRHAEARKSSPSGDRARELTKRGREVVDRVGVWMLSQGVQPDVVVTSPAVRALQTWEALRHAGMEVNDVWSDETLYNADADTLIESIRDVPSDVRTLLLIGHSPGIPTLAAALPDHTELDATGHEVMDHWPPAAVAVVSHRGTWSEFPLLDTAVALFHAPSP